MAKTYRKHDREEMLADLAEMYYLEGKTQVEISITVGITRSAISRLLTEARQKGVVEINICRPLRFETDLKAELKKRFGLSSAHVVICQNDSQTAGLVLELDQQI